jgi:hypothetical protein
VAFCVARALQLIDASSLFSSQIRTAVSGVCFGSFQSRPSSAPEVGKTLDKMTGMKMLDQLYYTAPYIEQDKSQIGVDKEDTAAYAEFLKKMAGLFGRTGAGQSGIDRIQVTENPGCVADAAKKYLNITDPKAIAAFRSIRKETTAAGNIRFVGDRNADGHADEFWAAALAKHATKADGPAFIPVSFSRGRVGRAIASRRSREVFA